MNKTEKIMLPGGAGLVGQNLVIELLNSGYQNIVVIDKHHNNLDVLRKMHPSIKAIEGDLADPNGDWVKEFENASVVVMLQAQIGAPTAEPFVRNNIESTKVILEIIKKYNIGYTVHISSSVVESVADDDYTNTKKIQEKIVLESGIPTIVLRPTLMFGWFDRKHLGWLSRFMKKFPIFPIPGDGKYMRQPLYAGDFAKIIASCIKQRKAGGVYNITGLERIDYIDIIKTIKAVNGAKAKIVKIPYGLFSMLLKIWAVFDKNPPFTSDQLKALVAHDEFEVINWPKEFSVEPTGFRDAIKKTLCDPIYGNVTLGF